MSSVAFLLLCLTSLAVQGRRYQFTDNPYTSTGNLTVEKYIQSHDLNGVPLHLGVFHPTKPGIYSVILFVGGWYGSIPAEFYDTVLFSIADHGFIILAVDTVFPLDVEPAQIFQRTSFSATQQTTNASKSNFILNQLNADDFPQLLFEELQWSQEHVNKELLLRSPGVVADFSS